MYYIFSRSNALRWNAYTSGRLSLNGSNRTDYVMYEFPRRTVGTIDLTPTPSWTGEGAMQKLNYSVNAISICLSQALNCFFGIDVRICSSDWGV